MWLYIPSNSAPESACLAKASEPHSSYLASTTEPFATWSGKPLQPRNLARLWKRERSIQRLSGLTCSPSTAAHGAALWMASLRASRAKTSPLLAAAPGSTASALDSSSACSTLPMIAVRGSLFWRTSQASLLPPPPLWTKPKAKLKSERPPASWENWPTAGGMRSGSLFQRPTLAPAMGGRDGSASLGEWLTPNVPNGGRCLSAELVASKGMMADGEKRTVGLESQTRHWATPNAHDGRRPGADLHSTQCANLSRDAALWATPDCNTSTYSNGRFGPNLRQQTSDWPTPRTTDGSKGGPNQAGSKGASAAAQWPTPTARIHKGGGECHRESGWEEPHGHAGLARGGLFAPGPTDPVWQQLLSAGRVGAWQRVVTDDQAGTCPWAPAAQPGVRMLADGMAIVVDESRSHQLRQIGNGVVPLQAAAAVVELLRRSGRR